MDWISGILGSIGGVLKVAGEWMMGYNKPAAVEARRINDEKQKKAEFDKDLELASKGDQEAQNRVRARLNPTP